MQTWKKALIGGLSALTLASGTGIAAMATNSPAPGRSASVDLSRDDRRAGHREAEDRHDAEERHEAEEHEAEDRDRSERGPGPSNRSGRDDSGRDAGRDRNDEHGNDRDR